MSESKMSPSGMAKVYEVAVEEWMNFARKYVLRTATLENEVADLAKELRLADKCIADLRKELERREPYHG